MTDVLQGLFAAFENHPGDLYAFPLPSGNHGIKRILQAGKYGPIEEYAQGEVKSYRGIVNRWLIVLYVALFLWAIYYLVTYWGCLGPGLGRVC